MNWFEPVFADLQAYAHLLAEGWRLMAICLLGATIGTVLVRLQRARMRILFASGFLVAWEAFLPKSPLGFLDGRVAGLQDEVLVVALLIIVGVVGILRSLRRPRVAILAISIAACMTGGLGYAYHLILINGMDGIQRQAESVQLSRALDLDNAAWSQVCDMQGLTCGSGSPRTGNAAFDKEVSDWLAHALRDGADGRVASSDGTLGAHPPHVWAAERAGGSIRWIKSDRSAETAALELAFFLFANAALIFWFGGAVLVEALHTRSGRRRPRAQYRSAQGPRT